MPTRGDTVHLTEQVRYHAGLDRVVELLADPAFATAKADASGALSHQVDVVGSPGEAFTVTTRRKMPTDAVPQQFRPLVGSTIEVRQVEAWEAPGEGTRRGTVVVEVTGAPVRLRGTMALVPDGDATVQQYDGELKATVPLFAAKVEEAVARVVRAGLKAEERTAATWLAR